MATSKSTGLKDHLSPQPDPNSMPITKAMKPLVSSTSPLAVELAQKFKELSVGSRVSSSPLSSSSSSSLQFSMSMPSETDMSLNLEKKKLEFENEKRNGSYPEGNIGEEMENIEKKQLTGRKFYPPPISYLRKVKVGKPYKYLTYDKESESYVLEEIKIPNESLFHASREDGRLKLYMNFSDEEESEEN